MAAVNSTSAEEGEKRYNALIRLYMFAYIITPE